MIINACWVCHRTMSAAAPAAALDTAPSPVLGRFVQDGGGSGFPLRLLKTKRQKATVQTVCRVAMCFAFFGAFACRLQLDAECNRAKTTAMPESQHVTEPRGPKIGGSCIAVSPCPSLIRRLLLHLCLHRILAKVGIRGPCILACNSIAVSGSCKLRSQTQLSWAFGDLLLERGPETTTMPAFKRNLRNG